jgi:tetratricopeptide (TPR) repeat protein
VLELLSVTSYALALLCKENAVTLLPLIALFRIVCRKEPLLRGLVTELRTLTWLPYALCTGLFILCRAYLTGAVTYGINVTPLDNALAFVPWEARVRSALGVLWDYFGLLNVPMVLSADYSYNQVAIVESWLNPRCLAGLLLLAAATMGVLCAQRGAMRFTVALPLVALLPTANLLFPIGTVKAERLLYLPSMGWILLVALGFDRLLGTPRYRSIATLALVAVALTFSARTWLRNGDWRDNATLFESTAYSAPRSAKARYNFGIALQDRGALDAAVGEYEQALAIASWTEGAAFGLGVNSEKRGRTAQAIQWYRRALEIAPDYDDAHTNLCHVLYDSGQFAAAASACRSGLRYKPADANLLKGLGASLVALGETDKGLELLRRSLALNTRDHELQVYVARLERTPAGSRTEAIGVE